MSRFGCVRVPMPFHTGFVKMAEPQDSGHQGNATLRLLAELRDKWIADDVVRSSPSAPSAPVKRVRWRVFVPLLFAVIALGFLVDHIWVGASHTSPHALWLPRGQVATRPARTGAPPRMLLQTAAPNPEPDASLPSPSPLPRRALRLAPRFAPSAPKISLPRTGQLLGYHVQTGAFNVREYAEDLMHQLRSHDYLATVVDAATGPPHRVWIAGTFDRPNAERLVSRLRRDGFEAILLPQ
jgi:cell division septation protein DedD